MSSSETPGVEEAAPPATIVPRWEWRTFDANESGFADRFAESLQESDELYLLSKQSDASVKVRRALMDVKRLERVDDEGLEQWLPVLKARFPISASEAGFVLTTLGVDPPTLERSEYSVDELVAEVVGPNVALLAVEVHKERRHYRIDGCMAELTEVRTEAGAARTIAVESEDPALVIETVRRLGLGSRRNVSLPRGLKALHSFGARRYAVIDIGTNSVKFHLGERRTDGGWRTIVDRAELSRLGEGLEHTGELDPVAIERTVTAVAEMVEEAKRGQAAAIAAVGTAALRIAGNSAAFVDAVRARSGIEVEVISGEEEGRLAYLAAISELGLAGGSLVVFDTGGGSSQFTFGEGPRIDERFSVDVGAVRFTERFGLGDAVSEDVLAGALAAISLDLARLDGRTTPDALVAMGGAVTNLAAVKHELATYDPDVVQGAALDRAEIDRQIELYRTRSAEQRRSIIGLQPKRADVILAGACIVRTVLEKLGCTSLRVSDRGLRHGVLEERFGR